MFESCSSLLEFQLLDRHYREAILFRHIPDPELDLIGRVVSDLPARLSSTPLVAGVSWENGRYDLLLTDGVGAWCAVEVKLAPSVYGSGSARKHRKSKWSRRLKKLIDQACSALYTCRARVSGSVRALALWFDGDWEVAWEGAA